MRAITRAFHKIPFKLVIAWVLLMLVAVGTLAAHQHSSLAAELEQESNILHRLVSQRADQHDAHLTALSAIVVAAGGERPDLFLDVAATISRFYPRIDEIQLVPLDPQAETAGIRPLTPDLTGIVRTAAKLSDGHIALLPHPDRLHHYVMVKRSPNSNAARYGLMMGIDAQRLVGEAGPFWSRPAVALRLLLPDGRPLVGDAGSNEAMRFSRTLGSASQPLLLETGMQIALGDLLPLWQTVLVLAGVSLSWLGVLAAWRQRARTRAAVEQARLSTLESRLAHASRVNALGEMASGLTHEITQPLTAILAQAQAGRRILDRGDMATLARGLDDIVAQARRASAILERFRNWSRPQRAVTVAFDLRDALRNVQALLAPQAAMNGTQLEFDLPQEPVYVVADPVEMEQVAFNLVRNAIEATDSLDGMARVAVILRQELDRTVLKVADNGPGVPADLRQHLFTPFTTTRAGGTGLGLALSQRLVERAGGDIALLEDTPGATFCVVLPRTNSTKEAAQ